MDKQPHVDRVTATPAALAALARLREQRGAEADDRLARRRGRRDPGMLPARLRHQKKPSGLGL